MTNPGLLLTRPYPFARLKKLFEGIEPAGGKLKPISLGIGEPQHPLPECIRKAVTDNLDMMSHYPGTAGTAALREAISRWCALRYQTELDAATQILPVLGSREALFSFTQSHIDASGAQKPVALIPCPFYQIYEGASLLAGAEPVYMPLSAQNGFLPDFSAISADVLARTQLVFVCSPGNPTGSVMKLENWKELGFNSETAVVFNVTSKEQVIINTWYGGEMKKGMFSMMNYFLPLKGIASMHCSANCDKNGENTAIFFGLSGTGKTTLSTDPKRLLIGDDEHGWDDNGVFNFEGGCYAKVINLDKESEPDIYNAIRRDALLENVTVDANGKIDFTDKSTTENTRVSYPIYHIDNIVRPVSHAPAAKQVIFLSADAFGVLPPVSILTPEQTKYYFLSGFTAKLAGTERGITEPTPTFSACFGQAFLELHPTKYAEELVKKMEKSGAKAYLVNTGWNGTGKRISIKDTRGIIDAILNGSINTAPTKTIPMFNFEVPTELPGVDPKILDPRDTYDCACKWEEKAKDLAARFIKNFAKYEGNEAGKALVAAGPKL